MGYVEVRWVVEYPCDFWCWFFGSRDKHIETHNYYYSYGGWYEEASGVKGTVYDADTGYPISGALVEAYQGSQLMGYFTSLQDGQYRIHLSPGTYRLEASRPGYDPKTYYNVVVPEEQYTTRNIQLDPTGFPIPI